MNRKLLWSLCTLATVLAVSFSAFAVRVGRPAPDFTGTDTNGKTHKLSEYHGKYVVLEWTNNGCPFTQKHYESGNMQALQKEWTAKGVVWLTVLSSAQGEQGYMTGVEENAYIKKENAAPTAALLDPSGIIGHEYEARTTPHMFVIDPSGKIIYAGAIDDHATTDPSDIKSSKNYISAALTESMSGQPVATSFTRPYGCSVKYSGAE
ncbi:thioredoxin family protein [Acidobacterium sp. S8]|uniref:thioredoxin family protein n=1 Tax=Acidobacterium sp. S8 TaxID=1641854 RepID=UPI00131B703C|nr:thioredoxin family protein [Acidobacterium sp. S8]